MLASNPTVFGPGPGQLVWFLVLYLVINLWWGTIGVSLLRRHQREKENAKRQAGAGAAEG